MKGVAEEIEYKIRKSKIDRAHDMVKLILFQNRTTNSVINYKIGELLIKM